MSTVSLDSYGGSITIYPTLGWEAATDGSFSFTLNYTLSSPHPVGSPFNDPSVLGVGGVAYGVENGFDPTIGGYNADANVPFSLTDITSAPEPAQWALLLVGFGVVGAALRGRREKSTRALP